MRPMRRRLGRVGLVLAILLALAVAWEPSRVALQTAALLPNLLGAGPRPLDLFSEAPARSTISYRPSVSGTAGDRAELWLPAWASAERRAGAMLLVFGVNNLGRNHPVIERVAEGLARTGVAVLVPDSRTLLAGRLEVGEIDGVVHAFETLRDRPEVDPERIGIVGFSVGGSLALLAAADQRIAADVGWVNVFGAYADARTYLAAVAAHAHPGTDSEEVAWEPSALAREVYTAFMLEQVTDVEDRARLAAAYGDTLVDPEADPPAGSAEVREALETDGAIAVHDLVTAGSYAAARDAIDALPAASLDFIDAISPVRSAEGLTADVYLMHEVTDHHVPIVESDALADYLAGEGLLVNDTRFRLFDHVQPDDIDFIAALPEFWKLLWHVHGLMVRTL
jgi:acetyl esterase/lipase